MKKALMIKNLEAITLEKRGKARLFNLIYLLVLQILMELK